MTAKSKTTKTRAIASARAASMKKSKRRQPAYLPTPPATTTRSA